MPTIPSAMPPAAGDSHRMRGIAEGFGADADRYDRTRPRYPAALAEAVLTGLPGRRVLDVGIGTGISALPFVDEGATVLGVDPDERMARVARARGLTVEVARFEDWDPAGRRFDAVVAGQTWHWVDPVMGASRAAAVLDPGGRLAVFWNAADPPPELAAAFAEVFRRVGPDLPFTPWATSMRDGYAGLLDRAEAGIRQAGGFGTAQRLRWDWEATIGRDDYLDQVPTSGGFHRLPPRTLAELLAGLGAAIDEAGGSFTMSYATLALVAGVA